MLQMTSVPLLLSTRRLQSQVSLTTEQHRAAQIEAVTGRAHDIAKAMDGDVGRVHELQKFIDMAEKRDQTLKRVQGEFKFVQLAMSNGREKAEGLSIRVTGALGLNDQNSLTAHAVESRAELDAVYAALNTSYAGKHLFSGAAVDTAPLGDASTLVTAISTAISASADAATAITALDTYFGAGGTFETTIYQGSTTDGPTSEISGGRRVGVDVTAIHDGFKDLIRGLVTVSVARTASNSDQMRDTLLQNAAEKLSEGGTSLLNKQAELGAIEEDLKLTQTRNASAKFTYETNLTQLIGRDQYEAATHLKNLETQLQATYLSTSRIANLSLVNYLR